MKYKVLLAGIAIALSTQSILANPAIQQVGKGNLSGNAATQYPIVMAHGLFGFNRLGTSAFGLDYYYQIPQDLARNGANVWITRQSAANSSELRGEQLLAEVQEILAITGKSKVNLIGHSHGSHSVRYVAGIIPAQVASVTAVAGPNKGAPLADLIWNNIGETPIGKIVGSLVSLATNLVTIGQLDDPRQYPMDTYAAAYSLSTKGSLAFNEKFPGGVPTSTCGEGDYTHNGVHYYSFSGTSQMTSLLASDPTDAGMLASSLLASGGQPNDGLVPKCSSNLGKVINNQYNWNHFDIVNQVLGNVGLFNDNPVTVYRQHANRLKKAGL